MSNAIIDTFFGILRRDGIDLKCTVAARRITLPGSDLYEHVRPSIVSVDGEVSAGNYELHADDKVTLLKFQSGHWLAR